MLWKATCCFIDFFGGILFIDLQENFSRRNIILLINNLIGFTNQLSFAACR